MATITGDLMTWHKITLDFASTQIFSETASTFRDFRLDVTFTNADTGEVITLPGYFAADGDAANTGATSGNIWRVNFNPPTEGDWSYTASFRTGEDIASKTYADAPNAGQAVAFADDHSGKIVVTETDKTGEDFRAKGMIVQDEGTHYLQHQGDQDYFVRGGPGIPENFLANTDFDNTANGRHDFATHVGDYAAGDPTWDGGKGKAIIGASNYLAEQGMNTIYLLTNTSGGDGQDVSPWTFAAQDTPKYDGGISANEQDKFSTYDVSKLTQWEIVFDHLDDKGIYKNVLLQETENDQQLDGGTNADGTSLSVERLVYIREMVARFGHNNGIQWNIGEENTNTDQQRADQAEYLKSVDGYDHLVVIHSFPGQIGQVYDPLLDDEDFDGASFQTNAQSIRAKVIEYRDKSEAADDPWVLAWDEDSSSNGIVDPYSNDPDSKNEVTLREAFWGMMTAGGSGGNWYFKGSSGHSLDQNYDTFEAHESVWTWTAAATSFFNTYIPFWDMAQADGLTSDNDDFVMVQEGQYYVIYAPYGEAGNINLDLNGQGGETFDVFWYNPREGGALVADGQVQGGSIQDMGAPPDETSKDWVLLVRNTDTPEYPTLPSGQGQEGPDIPIEPPIDEPPENPDTGEESSFMISEMKNGLVVMQAEDGDFVFNNNSANNLWKQTNQFKDTKGDGAMLWTGQDYFQNSNGGTSKTAPIEYKFEVDEPGTYYISLRATRPNTGEKNDRNNDFHIQFEDDGYKKLFFSGGTPRNEYTFATRYDISHEKSDAKFTVTQSMINKNDGVFTLTVSARSTMAALDEIHINKDRFSKDHDAKTSDFIDGSSGGGGNNPPPPTDDDNEAPNAKDDNASTDHNKTILIDVLANDSDPDGDKLTLTNVSYKGDGSRVSIEDGKILVNPKSGVTDERTEVITYTVKDASGASDTATLKVDIAAGTVVPVPPEDEEPEDPTPPSSNDDPVAKDDTAETPVKKTIFVDVTANDSDPNGDKLTLTDVSYDGTTSRVRIEDGLIKVNPLKTALEARVEVITYTVTDGNGGTDTAVLKVAIGGAPVDDDPTPPSGGNDAPTAKDDAAQTAQNKTIVVNVLANDSDPDGDDLTITDVVYNGSTSKVTIVDNMVKVNPLKSANNDRVETVTYTVEDEEGNTATAELNVTIGNPVDDGDPGDEVDPDPEDPPTPEALLKVFIADATSDKTLTQLTDGAELSAAALGDNFTFYATSEFSGFDFVTLEFEGITRTEKVAPYALFGDKAGDFAGGLDLDPGSYALQLQGFDSNRDLIETVNLNFELNDTVLL